MSRAYDLEFRLERAKEIEHALYKKGWTKTVLASKTGYDEKTIRNLFSGNQVKHQTLLDVCQALDIEARIDNDIENIECADDVFGGYLRKTHVFYEGFYYLYRYSFTAPQKIFRSVVKIEWDDTEERFAFSEFYCSGDDDKDINQHSGVVYMSPYTNLVHLLTIYQGSVRLMTVSKMRQSDWIMRGAISTQREGINFFQPVISPVVLRKLKSYETTNLLKDITLIDKDNSDFEFAAAQIKIAEENVIQICK